MLVWIDLETTGLDHSKEKILEVACVITDDKLVELARFQRVTSEAQYCDLSKVNAYVRKMHVDNGLWNESILASDDTTFMIGENGQWILDDQGDPKIAQPAASRQATDADLCRFIHHACRDHGVEVGEKKGPQAAGSTIGFDRAFMQVHLPRAHALLHYRSLDVTSLNEFAKRFVPWVYEARPRGNDGVSKHRAMDDILESLEVARNYARNHTVVSS